MSEQKLVRCVDNECCKSFFIPYSNFINHKKETGMVCPYCESIDIKATNIVVVYVISTGEMADD